jgi:hypothetical protein
MEFSILPVDIMTDRDTTSRNVCESHKDTVPTNISLDKIMWFAA